jgi:hypothetical protein
LPDRLITPDQFTSDTRWIKYSPCIIHEMGVIVMGRFVVEASLCDPLSCMLDIC